MSEQKPDFTVGCAFGVLVVMALVGLLALAGAGSGGGTTDSNNHTEVHILSDNQILSPHTVINSGNRNTVVSSRGETLCLDPKTNQYNAAACTTGQQP
jgi:hypothetical protein